MSDISMRQLGKMVRKLHISDGDLLLIKGGSGLSETETINKIADEIGKTLGVANCMILVAENLDDLSRLDHKAMYKHGWIQIDRLAELFQRKRGISKNLTMTEIVNVMKEDTDASKDDAAPEPLQG